EFRRVLFRSWSALSGASSPSSDQISPASCAAAAAPSIVSAAISAICAFRMRIPLPLLPLPEPAPSGMRRQPYRAAPLPAPAKRASASPPADAPRQSPFSASLPVRNRLYGRLRERRTLGGGPRHVRIRSKIMAETSVLEAVARPGTGKGAARKARREGYVPGVVYGGGEAPQSINIRSNELLKELKAGRFLARLVTLRIDGKDSRVICRAVQRDVVKDLPIHVDFFRLSERS